MRHLRWIRAEKIEKGRDELREAEQEEYSRAFAEVMQEIFKE